MQYNHFGEIDLCFYDIDDETTTPLEQLDGENEAAQDMSNVRQIDET